MAQRTRRVAGRATQAGPWARGQRAGGRPPAAGCREPGAARVHWRGPSLRLSPGPPARPGGCPAAPRPQPLPTIGSDKPESLPGHRRAMTAVAVTAGPLRRVTVTESRPRSRVWTGMQ